MGLEKFNPFKKDSPIFPSVVISLADAPAHSLAEKADKESNQSLDGSSSSENGAAGSKDSTHLTLEALRAEVESDVSTSTNDSAYDRMFLPEFHTGPRVATPCNWVFDLTRRHRKGKGDQQSSAGYRHGPVPVAAVRPLWIWLDSG
jgi:hypothetical protein